MAWKRKPIPPSSPGLTMKVMPTVTDKVNTVVPSPGLSSGGDGRIKSVNVDGWQMMHNKREAKVRQDGSRAESNEEIAIEACDSFHRLLGTSLLGEMVFDDECLAEGQLLDDQHRARLSVDFTESDVKDALWDMEDNKSS
ncbi:hypothetical protein Dimus_024040 [Dionaea muscipula]